MFSLRIHPKIKKDDIEYCVVSSEVSFDSWSLVIGWFGFCDLPKEALGFCVALDIYKFDWKFHRFLNWENKCWALITTSSEPKIACNWVDVLITPDCRSIYDSILGIGYVNCYLVPKRDFLGNSLEGDDNDDDPSYTKGYREGCTGLRWL